MSTRDPRVDSYIEKAAAFARPILDHIRMMIHREVPDVVETIKWGMPHFVVHGRNLAGMAAFKQHASLGLWRGAELGLGKQGEKGGMGSFGQLRSIADLPQDQLLADLIRRAAALEAAGSPRRTAAKPSLKPAIEPPADLLAMLAANSAAQTVWDGFSPSCRREYCEWIVEAKRPETRQRRLEQTIEQVAEGKDRNWKYRRGTSA